MRIKHLSVEGLFGVFNHSIPMNLDDRITIIHGPNGFGKTILLKMLDGLFNARYNDFRNIPFKEFRIVFDDQSIFWIEKKDERTVKRNKKNQISQIVFHFHQTGQEPKSYPLRPPDTPREIDFPMSVIEHEIPDLERVATTTWRYIPTNEELSLGDVFERFGDLLPIRPQQLLLPTEKDWLDEFRKSIHVRLIQTQRLLSSSYPRQKYRQERQASLVPTVVRYSEELASAIKATLTEYATLSQSLDRSFPARLVQQEPASELNAIELTNKLGELEQKRSNLMQAGLLDKEEEAFQLPQKIDEAKTSVLSVYVEDVEKKLGVFDELAAKIRLFREIINTRFLNKSMLISKENGFVFETSNATPLSPANLSSGEQHELVLLYELLFKVKSNSLILVDEPEISLHVAWQEQFLKDLQEITTLSRFDVLIATHSPQIISDRWDLTVQLRNGVHA